MNEFKIGDKVRLRDDLEVGRRYGKLEFLSGMRNLEGKELTIDFISEEGNYGFEESGYVCSEEMLKKVFNDSDLLEFALDKLNIAKEELEKELREEYEKNNIDKQELEHMKKRYNDLENHCSKIECSTCEVYKFKKRHGIGAGNCILVYEYLFNK